MLLAAIAGASVGYLLLGVSWNIYVVVLSRIPAALFKHTLDLIRVAITDREDPQHRYLASHQGCLRLPPLSLDSLL